ncbi:helix-turn-helix transcriptional regulator [Nocardioides sp. zg-DK7169]|uniref:helix-turn-helix domain-containing protein n=1 Tax=Nocardioides sp. zg-DK7169 TaxID=2736600 RepID=UPI001554F6C4|nr:helix-turn-helix transcriptional regulator [Nocardioides sp. zg-DK7169]NPC97194.1 hypothetical protein [Nocardioides sp. zg-DK7169]
MTRHDPGPLRAAVPVEPADPAVIAAVRHLYAGRVSEALQLLEQPAPGPRRPADQVLASACTIEARLGRGELDVAMRAGEGLLAMVAARKATPAAVDGGADGLAADSAHDPVAAIAHHSCGELAAALGDTEDALEHHLECGRLLGPTPADPQEAYLLPWRGSAAIALVRLGRGREGNDLATEWLEVATASGSPLAHAHALRILAVVGAGPHRTERLTEARALLLDHPAPRLAAQIDTDLAALMLLQHPRESPERQHAVRMLRDVEEYAGREQLRPLQARARGLLARVGEAPRPHQREALATLTPTEQRVARLAADGLTNRQIAETLVVTVKAVEWHLSHVYRKLDIRSRTRLAAAFDLAV